MNIIDSYNFGRITINGEKHTSDVIIFPDSVKDNWLMKRSHQLSLEDIAGVLAQNPEVLIVGTGAYGLVKVLPEVERATEAQGIKLVAEPTKEACQTYNQLCRSQKVVAALHLTC